VEQWLSEIGPTWVVPATTHRNREVESKQPKTVGPIGTRRDRLTGETLKIDVATDMDSPNVRE